jgi:hypothetical protein
MTGLAPFPVDDFHLDQLDEATQPSGEFSLLQLCRFLSGWEDALEQPRDEYQHLHEHQLIDYTGGPVYHPHDVIRALIAEIRRLRGEQP